MYERNVFVYINSLTILILIIIMVHYHYLDDSFVDVEQRERGEELNDNLPSPDRPRIPPPSIIRLK